VLLRERLDDPLEALAVAARVAALFGVAHIRRRCARERLRGHDAPEQRERGHEDARDFEPAGCRLAMSGALGHRASSWWGATHRVRV
jgi:hypothetical protein